MTGTHPVTQEEVMAWLDGELPAARAAEIAVHVDACADCDALAGDLRTVSDRVSAWTVELAPSALRAGAHVAIAPTVVTTSRRWLPRRVLLATAIAATVVLAILVPLTRRLVVRSDQANAISVELAQPATTVPGVEKERGLRSLGYVSPPTLE